MIQLNSSIRAHYNYKRNVYIYKNLIGYNNVKVKICTQFLSCAGSFPNNCINRGFRICNIRGGVSFGQELIMSSSFLVASKDATR